MDGFRNTCMTAGAPDLKFASTRDQPRGELQIRQARQNRECIAWLLLPKFALLLLSGAANFGIATRAAPLCM
jgi:hypothetical protein